MPADMGAAGAQGAAGNVPGPILIGSGGFVQAPPPPSPQHITAPPPASSAQMYASSQVMAMPAPQPAEAAEAAAVNSGQWWHDAPPTDANSYPPS